MCLLRKGLFLFPRTGSTRSLRRTSFRVNLSDRHPLHPFSKTGFLRRSRALLPKPGLTPNRHPVCRRTPSEPLSISMTRCHRQTPELARHLVYSRHHLHRRTLGSPLRNLFETRKTKIPSCINHSHEPHVNTKNRYIHCFRRPRTPLFPLVPPLAPRVNRVRRVPTPMHYKPARTHTLISLLSLPLDSAHLSRLSLNHPAPSSPVQLLGHPAPLITKLHRCHAPLPAHLVPETYPLPTRLDQPSQKLVPPLHRAQLQA